MGWPAAVKNRTKAKANGCPESECAKYGFNPANPAHVYVLFATIQETQVIQFGISNDIRTRLSKHARSGFTDLPVRLISLSKGSRARILEKSLKILMNDYDIPSCFSQNIKFPGSTEAFCLEDTDEEFLEEFMELVGA